MKAILLVILLLVGVAMGIIGTLVYVSKARIGYIRVDRSIPEEPPYLFLELTKPISDFQNKKYVVCRINVENYISQK